MAKKIGFIGLGIMGKPMAKNLLKAGYALYVYDIVKAAVDELAAAGAIPCATIREITDNCDTIVTMLPNSPHVKTVVLGDGGVAQSARPGTLIVDMSSIAPMASQEIQKELVKKGIRMVDAPVSGGEPKAIDGTLAIMVGGEQADYDEAKPLFDILGASAVLVGPIGSGNTCKLTNQIIVALNIAALSEGLLLAQMAGTDPRKVFDAIKGGLAGSTVMNAKAPMMLEGNFKPGFKIDLHIKDLANALDTAAAVGTPLMLTAEVMQMLQHLHRVGEGQSDHSAILKFYEKMADTEVRSEG
ncbi:MAG: 2-hydroxy-3-oxopropionate reductase [Clostridiaceae bacterium]|jgi:2-hydroxy-3-oxopropionate reductase|nr:2-hydroxy-3-oxopropionate reductase [Clostridiaceae bacterium]